jgi:hypothetical protein
MKDIYQRLGKVGFDAAFVRGHVLPDWWNDSLGNNPANRAIAEMSISRMLGVAIKDLHDPKGQLHLPAFNNFRLKRTKGTAPSDLVPALLLATQSAKAVVHALPQLPEFTGTRSAVEVRAEILTSRAFVDLEALLDFAWRSGIVVLHLSQLPKYAKKFSGMALFCNQRPVIVLGSGRESPSWVAYHLAHELGHVLLGHVTAESQPLVDSNLDKADQAEDEIAADRYACEFLTGIPDPGAKPIYGLSAPLLVAKAREMAQQYRVDPGVIALVYGRNAGRMPAAQNALKLMGLDTGARSRIAAALHAHLPHDLPESTERIVSLLASTAAA